MSTPTTTPAPAAATVAPSTLSTVETTVKTDVSKVSTELSFVEANWGKLSAIVVGSAIIGALVGHLLV